MEYNASYMATFGSRPQARMDEIGMKQPELADKSGVSQPTISQIVNGRNKDSRYAVQLAAALKCSPRWLVTGRLPKEATNVQEGPEIRGKVPLLSYIQAGNFAAVIDNLPPGEADDWIPTSVPIHEHTYALRVNGDSMWNPNGDPSFPHGSIVIVEPDSITDLAGLAGQLVIWKRAQDEEATFKKLVRDGGEYLLVPLNPQYPTMKVEPGDVCCGVVRSKEQRFF